MILNGRAPSGGLGVRLLSSKTAVVPVPLSVTVSAGPTTASFKVTTVGVRQSAGISKMSEDPE